MFLTHIGANIEFNFPKKYFVKSYLSIIRNNGGRVHFSPGVAGKVIIGVQLVARALNLELN